VVISRLADVQGSIFNNIVVPRMLSPNEWDWAGMTGFFYAGLTVLLILFMYFMLPETSDRSFAELDVLFENKVSARKFHKTNVDQFSGHSTMIQADDSSDAASVGEKSVGPVRKENV
jgi:SP family general alpha glucoside:H+ symporter-like MFS transporter